MSAQITIGRLRHTTYIYVRHASTRIIFVNANNNIERTVVKMAWVDWGRKASFQAVEHVFVKLNAIAERKKKVDFLADSTLPRARHSTNSFEIVSQLASSCPRAFWGKQMQQKL